MPSPYNERAPEEWLAITKELVAAHPLDVNEIVEVVTRCWEDIFTTSIGGKLRIGTDVFPVPQILSSFLHEMIPLDFEGRHPGVWRRDQSASEKDLVHVPDQSFSVEIKCSSQKNIYGNRSFTQESEARPAKKEKSGYYLAVNFPPIHKLREVKPITTIRFGWLDITDWKGQAAASGQQASLSREALTGKLLTLYP